MFVTHGIRVLGRDLQVKSTSTPEHVAQVETLVNEKLAEAEASLNGADSQIAAILAMMNLAEDYLAAKKEIEEQRRQLRARVAGLIERLDGEAV